MNFEEEIQKLNQSNVVRYTNAYKRKGEEAPLVKFIKEVLKETPLRVEYETSYSRGQWGDSMGFDIEVNEVNNKKYYYKDEFLGFNSLYVPDEVKNLFDKDLISNSKFYDLVKDVWTENL